MRLLPLSLVAIAILLQPLDAHAGPADAREVARLNNCTPKKIEVYSQTLGSDSQTVYRIECNMPKTKEEASAPATDALLVQCNGALCDLLRPLANDAKK